jgi:hypothetical protein
MYPSYVLLIMRGRIVGNIVVQSSSQRSLVPHDHVVPTLATDRAHQSFHKWILPRGSRCRKRFLIPISRVMAAKPVP